MLQNIRIGLQITQYLSNDKKNDNGFAQNNIPQTSNENVSR